MEASTLPFDQAAVAKVVRAVRGQGFSQHDAEEAAQIAFLETWERAMHLNPGLGLILQKAKHRALDIANRHERRNDSLDRLAEADPDTPPVELGVAETDFESHVQLRDADDHPVLSLTKAAAECGAPAIVQPRGRAHCRSRYSDEQVNEARALKGKLTYPQIAERTGVPLKTVERWCRRETRLAPAASGWSRDLIVETIQRFHREEGRWPAYSDLPDPRLPAMYTVRRYFGHSRGYWLRALAAAGCDRQTLERRGHPTNA